MKKKLLRSYITKKKHNLITDFIGDTDNIQYLFSLC